MPNEPNSVLWVATDRLFVPPWFIGLAPSSANPMNQEYFLFSFFLQTALIRSVTARFGDSLLTLGFTLSPQSLNIQPETFNLSGGGLGLKSHD